MKNERKANLQWQFKAYAEKSKGTVFQNFEFSYTPIDIPVFCLFTKSSEHLTGFSDHFRVFLVDLDYSFLYSPSRKIQDGRSKIAAV